MAVVIVGFLIASCATNPATGRRQLMLMSEAQEIELGRESDREIRQQMGVYQDQELQRYVSSVGQRLARASHRPNLPWTFTVVDAAAVNAFALPGGFVYVTRGIMPFLRDEAELAAVLGHETGHVDARHSAAAYSRQVALGGTLALGSVLFPKVGAVQGAAELALGLAFLRNSRDAELEADQLGVGYASTSGWRPDAMQGLLGTLGRLDEASGSSRGIPNWALTHPPAADRIEKVQQAIAAARSSGATTTNRAELERHLDGMVYGDSREQGIVRGNEFVHPIMRLAMRFPSGWEIANSPEAVTAAPPQNGQASMTLQLVDGNSDNPAQVARAVTTNAGFQEVSGRQVQMNGLSPYVGTYQGTISGQPVGMRAAFVRVPSLRQGQFVLVAGLATTAQFNRVDDQFDASIGSFRTLSQSEADRIQPSRVDYYVVRGGDSWESIARGVGGGAIKASTLAIMNGSTPATPPRAGDRIRVVVAGS
jgi:predicted Zn-dependent protease